MCLPAHPATPASAPRRTVGRLFDLEIRHTFRHKEPLRVAARARLTRPCACRCGGACAQLTVLGRAARPRARRRRVLLGAWLGCALRKHRHSVFRGARHEQAELHHNNGSRLSKAVCGAAQLAHATRCGSVRVVARPHHARAWVREGVGHSSRTRSSRVRAVRVRLPCGAPSSCGCRFAPPRQGLAATPPPPTADAAAPLVCTLARTPPCHHARQTME